MNVYRIETEQGGGPYMGLSEMDFQIHVASNGAAHPPPHRDGCAEGTDKGYLCGFQSVEQGRQWFGSSVELARAINRHRGELSVSVYDVPEDAVVVGRAQVMFDRERAKLLERLPVEYLTCAAFVTKVTR